MRHRLQIPIDLGEQGRSATRAHRGPVRLTAPAGLFVLAFLTGCTGFLIPQLSRVTNLSDSACKDSFSAQLAATLVKQGEPEGDAKAQSTVTVTGLSYVPEGGAPRPGPFHVTPSSGHRYGYIVQQAKSGCLLRLYERTRGRFSDGRNDPFFFDTRDLTGCSCAPNEAWPVWDRDPLKE